MILIPSKILRSNLLNPKRRNDILIVLKINLPLILLLRAIHQPRINYQILLAQSLRFLLLHNPINTFPSLLSIFGRYSRYGSPVVNLITLFRSSIDSFFFFFFITSSLETYSSFKASLRLLSGLFISIS